MNAGQQSHEVPHLLNFNMVEPGQHTPGGTLHVLHGDEMGLREISLLLSFNPPGGGPTLHTHSYVELFVPQQVVGSTR